MTKQLFITLSLAISALLTGCSKGDPSPIDPYTPSENAIGFESKDNWSGNTDKTDTRALVTDDLNFRIFSVLAYYSAGTTSEVAAFDPATSTPNFMYNQVVNKDALGWSYSPIKYWPNNDNDRIRFFAYSPLAHSSTGVTLSSNSDVGYPTISHTPTNKPYSHADLITASTGDLAPSSGTVKFAFKHKLAQAKIYFAAKLPYFTDEVSIINIEVSGLQSSGKLIYDPSVSDFVWEHKQPGFTGAIDLLGSYILEADEDGDGLDDELDPANKLKHLAAATNNVDDYTDISLPENQALMLLIPQETNSEIKFSVYFRYIDSVEGLTAYATKTFKLPSTTLVQGEGLAYLIFIDPSDIGFGSITATKTAWIDKAVTNGLVIE